MNPYGYDGPERFRPLSPWAYFGYTLLVCVPVVGLIALIVLSVNGANVNRRSFARGYLIGLLFFLLLAVVITVYAGLSLLSIPEVRETLRALRVVRQYI